MADYTKGPAGARLRAGRQPVYLCRRGANSPSGGTALNLFVFDIPRLSVAIDPNCMGTESRSAVLEERPDSGRLCRAVSSREDCTVRLRPSEHRGGKWSLRYPRRRVPSAAEKPEPVLELLEQAERWPGE